MPSRPRRRQIHIAHLYSCRFGVQPDRPKGKSVSNLIFALLLRQIGQAELFEHTGRVGPGVSGDQADQFVKDGGKCGRRDAPLPRPSAAGGRRPENPAAPPFGTCTALQQSIDRGVISRHQERENLSRLMGGCYSNILQTTELFQNCADCPSLPDIVARSSF
jgi:hypothetical protein